MPLKVEEFDESMSSTSHGEMDVEIDVEIKVEVEEETTATRAIRAGEVEAEDADTVWYSGMKRSLIDGLLAPAPRAPRIAVEKQVQIVIE